MASTEGTRFETDVVKKLKAAGFPAGRPTQTKMADVGDIHLGADWVLQAKAWANVASALREGTKDAQVQAYQARRRFGAAVIKKTRGSIDDAFVAMPLSVFIEFIQSQAHSEEPETI